MTQQQQQQQQQQQVEQKLKVLLLKYLIFYLSRASLSEVLTDMCHFEISDCILFI